MNDRRQAISQQPRLAIDLDAQVIRHSLQRTATQYQLQLFIEFRVLQRLTQASPKSIGVPAQLTLRDRVEVLQVPLAVDHQQTVVDAVEHRLQTLLPCQQLIDIGGLVLA
ncbi:hypothetical protein D3C72_2117620 [compost metagenome]